MGQGDGDKEVERRRRHKHIPCIHVYDVGTYSYVWTR
jgi:hypothetical protein